MAQAPSLVSVALLFGLSFFLGLAFEEFFGRADTKQPGGVRTFPMLALAGGLLYLLDPSHFVPFTGGLVVLGAWLFAYYQAHLREPTEQEDSNVALIVPASRMLTTMSDSDIGDLAAFYSNQKAQPAEQGKVLVAQTIAKCDRCHGGIGAHAALAIPVIAGQDKDYLVMALRAYRDGKRGSSVMHYMSQPYNDAIIESIASHYANQ